MVVKKFVCLLVLVVVSTISFSQKKAIIVGNSWVNDLNNYNPKEYLDRLSKILEDKLKVKELYSDAGLLSGTKKDEAAANKVGEIIKSKNFAADTAYFVTVATELKLPVVNLGKFLFKNPPRSSKLIFTIHVYNGAGAELIGDTIINRGCVVRAVDEEKGGRGFYPDYNSFINDMQCHLAVIEKILREKKLPKKTYMEI